MMTGRGTYHFLKQALSENKYEHEDLVRRDVMNVLSQFKDLRPTLEPFMFPDGTRKEILNLDGTIPVTYKDSIYNIPICVSILDTHPFKPPMVYVKPTSTMQIKPSENVDCNGTVDLPFLRDWQYPESDLLGLIQILVIVFGEKPPLFTKSSPEPESPSPRAASELAQNSPRNSNQVQEFYLKHFEKFLVDFGINFVRDEFVENGIDNLETFLMLEKDDFLNVLGFNLGNTLKCMKAQKKFSELES